ncbi:Acetyltransferase [Candidatus Rhodobacter oscarellae]|uniref:Acetyltransferase n=2 Tax=Candidatus Rhodobacter oscarellae TaxID=1675527 RepID=A0A0J9GX96_9RHOB|nr:Acetyltransferase [Candidatus Rhodobacter lobularis]
MKLTTQSKEIIGNFPLGFVATVTPGGRPAVSPKGTFLVLDDATIAFGEIRSPGTVANLAINPECEVNFVDPFLRKGVRIRGEAQMLRQGTDGFDALIGRWRETWGDLADRINIIVKIPVAEAKPLTAPPYDDGATEAEMIALYKAKYAGIYP